MLENYFGRIVMFQFFAILIFSISNAEISLTRQVAVSKHCVTLTSEFWFSFKYQTHLYKICTSSLLLLKILQAIICQEDISLERNSWEKTLYSPSDIGQQQTHAQKKRTKTPAIISLNSWWVEQSLQMHTCRNKTENGLSSASKEKMLSKVKMP